MMLKHLLLLTLARAALAAARKDSTYLRSSEKLTGEALVDYVNSHQHQWTARYTPVNVDQLKSMLGLKRDFSKPALKSKERAASLALEIDLPKEFDARTKWPDCIAEVGNIRDQAACGSCWAFGAVESMSDRICIASNGTVQVSLSADDLMTCFSGANGCNGAHELLPAWQYWVTDGIVTGSNYTAKEGCRPYPFAPCEHDDHVNVTHYPRCPQKRYPTPKCEKKCQDSYNTKTYDQDKHYGLKAYSVDSTVEAIQKELYTNGPLEVGFQVYMDWFYYYGGVYSHRAGALAGAHAVRLIGWGEENGVPYWTIANSWNADWGLNGIFKILRGKNECGIESTPVAGLPDLKRSGY
ncbi:Protein CPR-6 c [Aphelenchoides avenae]|nr:Protein CPR-6 c [Aphelenchus avenae]